MSEARLSSAVTPNAAAAPASAPAAVATAAVAALPTGATSFMIVDKPGLLTTLQDRGRYGYQRFGVPVNGAMDERAHRTANILVGNHGDQATLEITVVGPTLRFDEDRLIALAGADLEACADGAPVPMHRAVLLRGGAALTFGKRRAGARCYLAVRGGFATEPVLESRSTFVRGGFGGFEGRALRKGDRVPVPAVENDADLGYPELLAPLTRSGVPFVNGPKTHRMRASDAHPSPFAIRFVPGPQWLAFTAESRRAWSREPFAITARSDRMGYRLEGTALGLAHPLEMISEPVSFGTVQVPPDGQPIVLMADRQGAGGYPKIADIISADLGKLAQAVPGDILRFVEVSHETAQEAYLEIEHGLTTLRDAVRGTLSDAEDRMA